MFSFSQVTAKALRDQSFSHRGLWHTEHHVKYELSTNASIYRSGKIGSNLNKQKSSLKKFREDFLVWVGKASYCPLALVFSAAGLVPIIR